MAAGLGFKTFTTGEVLTAADTNGYLMQGVLVFASAAARDAAITSPQEGQCCYLKDTDAVLTYSGAAWVGFDDSNAIQNSIVDAKGDLIAASANDTPARLAVGANGETLIADSSTGTGLKWFSLAKTATDYQAASVNNPAGTAYAASAGTDPTVTITTGTKALIIVQARFFTTNVNFVSFDVSGATTIAAADSGSATVAFGSSSMGTAVTYLDNLTAGSNTFTMKYKCNVTASGSYDLRRITVVVL